ncbi:hypothetical protein AVEN_267881-1 [Araneus ventricosus]|uniref:Uncharacterized protein n=1 Tax=Araneus ventricosus TaxID=182803 RepID=A0A4Y2H925_ARAVE|nr:hypothetical protein AVEN_267881-1 [Araneus ventricosus]
MGQRFNWKEHPPNPNQNFPYPYSLGKRQDIIFASVHGPFPSYCKRFHIKDSECCGRFTSLRHQLSIHHSFSHLETHLGSRKSLVE